MGPFTEACQESVREESWIFFLLNSKHGMFTIDKGAIDKGAIDKGAFAEDDSERGKNGKGGRMTKQENHLFCRIAVHNRLVSLEDANACLREALASGRDVGIVFLEEGLLSEEQVRKVTAAVRKHSRAVQEKSRAKAPAARPRKPRRRGEPLRGPRREPASRPVSSNQLALIVASLVVLLVVIIVFVVIWMKPREEGSSGGAVEPSEGTAATAGEDAGGPAVSKGPSGSAEKVKAPPSVSPEEKDLIEDACNQALGDATQSVADRIGKGVASLDNFMKRYGDRASEEQKNRIKAKREQLISVIRRRYEGDKKRLLEAKQQGDKAKIREILDDIKFYADEDTIKEAEELATSS